MKPQERYRQCRVKWLRGAGFMYQLARCLGGYYDFFYRDYVSSINQKLKSPAATRREQDDKQKGEVKIKE